MLLDRAPFAAPAVALWSRIEAGAGQGLVAAHAVTTLFYLLRKDRGLAFARRALPDLLSVFEVAGVDGPVVQRALALGWTDFEDAVTAACALSARATALVTRDPTGFRDCPIAVVDPRAALALLPGR